MNEVKDLMSLLMKAVCMYPDMEEDDMDYISGAIGNIAEYLEWMLDVQTKLSGILAKYEKEDG